MGFWSVSCHVCFSHPRNTTSTRSQLRHASDHLPVCRWFSGRFVSSMIESRRKREVGILFFFLVRNCWAEMQTETANHDSCGRQGVIQAMYAALFYGFPLQRIQLCTGNTSGSDIWVDGERLKWIPVRSWSPVMSPCFPAHTTEWTAQAKEDRRRWMTCKLALISIPVFAHKQVFPALLLLPYHKVAKLTVQLQLCCAGSLLMYCRAVQPFPRLVLNVYFRGQIALFFFFSEFAY